MACLLSSLSDMLGMPITFLCQQHVWTLSATSLPLASHCQQLGSLCPPHALALPQNPEPHSSPDDAVQTLIRSLLRRNPTHRPSARALLKHPWICSPQSHGRHPSLDLTAHGVLPGISGQPCGHIMDLSHGPCADARLQILCLLA